MMQSFRPAVRRLALAGRVTDSVTGLPLAGAVAEITAMPKEFRAWADVRRMELASRRPPLPPPELAVADADGWFRFLDLPAGKYTVDVSLPPAGRRYGAGRAKAEVVTADGARWADASVQLAPTAVSGRVVDQDGLAVPLAEVRVKGSLETACTDRDGNYALVAIEWGDRVVTASARGFSRVDAVVKLPGAGKAKTQNFTLARQG